MKWGNVLAIVAVCVLGGVLVLGYRAMRDEPSPSAALDALTPEQRVEVERIGRMLRAAQGR